MLDCSMLPFKKINSFKAITSWEDWISLLVSCLSTKVIILLICVVGAGGLSTGLHLSGYIDTKWAVEFSPSAAKSFKWVVLYNQLYNQLSVLNSFNPRANHEKTTVYDLCSSCLLQHAIDSAGGKNPPPLRSSDGSKKLPSMPQRGEVDFIYGGKVAYWIIPGTSH